MTKKEMRKLLRLASYSIVSASRADQTFREGEIATRSVGQLLRALGLPVEDCTGWFEGGPEASIIIFRSAETFPAAVARAFEQVCYIVRQPSDAIGPATAECVFPGGERVTMNPNPVFMRVGQHRDSFTIAHCYDGDLRFYFKTTR